MRRATRAVALVLSTTAVAIATTAVAATSTLAATRTTATHSRCAGGGLLPTRTNMARVSAATLCLIEHERSAYRLKRLRPNRSLLGVAQSQAREMVIGDYFGDDSLSGWTPLRRIESSPYAASAHGLSVGQNIGWGTGSLATPAAIVRGWMHSPPHREIMLSGEYSDVGVGVASAAPASLSDGLAGATYTVEFAARG